MSATNNATAAGQHVDHTLDNLIISEHIHLAGQLARRDSDIQYRDSLVAGKYCITCKPIVEKQLKNEEAVKKIDIDYMTDRIVVEFDSSMKTKEEIKNKLEKSGYKFVRTASTRYI